LALHVISLLDYACVEGAVLGKGGWRRVLDSDGMHKGRWIK
jgi:hypothetical protein